MPVEPTGVGVQYRHRPGFALEFPLVAAEALHRRPGGRQERRVDGARWAESQGPQFARQGEGKQERFGRYLQAALAFQPAFALMVCGQCGQLRCP